MIPGTFPNDEKLVIHVGASNSMRLTFEDDAGVAIDLSGRTFIAQARDSWKRPLKVNMTVAGTDLLNGIIDISWTAADTRGAIPGPTRWGLMDDTGALWIDDVCTISNATPRSS